MIRVALALTIASIVILFGVIIFLHVRQLHTLGHRENIAEVFNEHQNLQVHPAVPVYRDMMLVCSILFISNAIHWLTKFFNMVTPDAVFVVMIGYILGAGAFHNSVIFLATDFQKIRAFDLFYIYIPVTVFNLSFGLDFQIFLKIFPQMLIIGIPVCFCTAFLFGETSKLVLDEGTWSPGLGFQMGLFAVPIYPRKITKLLKNETNRTKHISVLLDTEALFTFIVVDITKEIIRGAAESIQTWYKFINVTLRFLILGTFSGFLFGLLGRYLLRKMYTNQLSIFLICSIIPFLTYGVSQEIISGCGSISVMVMGIMLSLERTILTKDTENVVLNFWDTAGYVLNVVVILRCSISLACMVSPYIEEKHYAILFVIFFLYYAMRFMSFLIFSPLLSRLGYGMDLKNMLVCVWAGLKSPFSLEVILQIQQYAGEKEANIIIYFHVMALFFLSLIINGSISPSLVDFLGLGQISMARQVNMNNCIKHMFAKREKTIAVLKMDRFLADANWLMVIAATDITHPYKTKLETMEEDDFLSGYRFTFCGDCKKDIPQTPTAKEMKDMAREAKMRILKAKQMSYSRQYENGMISNEGIRILSQAVELAMDSDVCTIKVSDLEKRFVEEGWFQRRIRVCAEQVELQKKNAPKAPSTYWRRICYNQVIKHRTFDKVMLGVIVVHLIIMSAELHFYPTQLDLLDMEDDHDHDHEDEQHSPAVDIIFVVFKPVFCIIYIIEFIMRILAYSRVYICRDGFRAYFKNFCYIIDFVALIGSVLRTLSSFYDILKEQQQGHYAHSHGAFRLILTVLTWTRFVRLLRVFDIFYPDVINYLNRAADDKMAFTYELGKSYTSGETEVLDKLPFMIDNKKIRDDMKATIEADRIRITKLLGTVQKERAWIAITVKTKQAIRTILCAMNDSMYSLKSSGWIDTYEYEKLQAALGVLYKNVNSIKKVQPSPPKVIFKEVSWMSGDEIVIDFLFENVTVRAFAPGDVVFEEGDVADGIYIVVTGLFLLTYEPMQNTLNSLHLYGKLPIVDYLSGTKFEEEAVDYIVSGNCIGELSTLTERAYNCSITAEAHSQVYVLSRGVLNRAMELSPDPITGLECRIWKEVSQRIALPLLLSVPAYQALSQDQIKYALERAFVPNLSNYKIFAVTDMIEEIVLIEGLAADYNTNETFVAPCCIPRNVQKLILPTSSLMNIPINIETKLMIIPEKDVDEYDVMLAAEETCEMINTGSAYKCLQHRIQDRTQKRQRKRGILRGRRRRSEADDTYSVGTSIVTSADTEYSGVTFGSSSSQTFVYKDGDLTSVNIEAEETEKRDVNYEESQTAAAPPPPPVHLPAKRRQSVFYM